MKKLAASALLLLLVPIYADAATFAKQSLFLSKSSVTEGDTVLIHAVVSNDAGTRFTGNLVFKDAAKTIGTVPLTLAVGEATTLSISWKPTGGSHTITADLAATDGTVVETESAQVTIAEKPKPILLTQDSNLAAAVESSQPIQDSLAKVSPIVADTAKPVFTTIDSARSNAVDIIDTQITNTKSALAKGSVLGAQTSKTQKDTAATSAGKTATTIFQTIYLYILTLLRVLFTHVWAFYPFIAVLFFYLLYRLYLRMNRPRWQR